MFDILAASYMSATRMDHYLEQDFLHKDPMISRRLRYIHGSTPQTQLYRGSFGCASAWMDLSSGRASRHVLRQGLGR